jgi:peptidoglycan/LPS O-acetylase OafA/YrhL
MTETLALVVQGLAFVLVAGALAMIVHALVRQRDRWRFPVLRFVWVLLGIAYIISMAAALIFKTDLAITVFGIAMLAILITELAYLLRVVFAAGRPAPRGDVTEASDTVQSTPEDEEDDLEFEEGPRP